MPLNRQPGKLNETAVQMLRDKQVKKYTVVFSADEHELGQALRLHHRTEDIDPNLKYYASYLEIFGVDYSTHLFVPTDFIDDYEADNETIRLSVKFKAVQNESWDRVPDFVVANKDSIEKLAQ